MDVTKLKEFLSVPSSDLLSAADKQLALSNAVEIGSRLSFDVCLKSNRSTDFKTVAAYTGFAIKGANYLWKQSMLERLSLAEKYPNLKKLVSPSAGAALNGGALTLSCFKEQYTSIAGWGLCQIQPIASAILVGQDSGKKIGKAWKCLSSRPQEAVQAIGVHGFNFVCELWRVFRDWTGHDAEAWSERQDSFSGNEKEALRFFHAISDPGMKITAEESASVAALNAYRRNLEKIEEGFDLALWSTEKAQSLIETAEQEEQFNLALRSAKKAQSLIATAKQAEQYSVILGKEPRSPDLSWQDYFAGQTAFETSVSRMNKKWQESWDSWGNEFVNQSSSCLEKISQARSDQIQDDFEQTKKMIEFLNQLDPKIVYALAELNASHMNHFSSQEIVKGIQRMVKKREDICKRALENKIDMIQAKVSRQLKGVPKTIGNAISSAPFDKMYGVLKEREERISRLCGNWSESLGSLNQNNNLHTPIWVAKKLKKAIQEIHSVCDGQMKRLKQKWDAAYLLRADEKVGIWARTKFWWDVGFSIWWSGSIPAEIPSENEALLVRHQE